MTTQHTGTIKVQIVDPAQMLEERKKARCVEGHLLAIRSLRDAEENSVLRHYFNEAADRLDVLLNNIIHQES